MSRGDMVSIVQAARAIDMPVDVVSEHIQHGRLDAVRADDGQWSVSQASLARLAADHGIEVRTPVERGEAVTAHSDVLAAQAAALLAKTQATAARFQSHDLFRRLRSATEAAAADRQARETADRALADAERSLQDLRRDQAVAEAKIRELRAQLVGEDRHFRYVVDRMTALEEDRRRLTQSLGWLGRRRYQRLVAEAEFDSRPSLDDDAPAPESNRIVEPPTTHPDAAIDLTEGRRYPQPELRA